LVLAILGALLHLDVGIGMQLPWLCPVKKRKEHAASLTFSDPTDFIP